MRSSIDFLKDVSNYVKEDVSQDIVLQKVLKATRSACKAHFCIIAFYDSGEDELYYKRICGRRNKDAALEGELFTRTPADKGVLGWCLKNKEVFSISDTDLDSRSHYLQEEQLGINIRSIMAVPLNRRDGTIGVIAVVNKINNHQFNKYDQKILEIVSTLTALSIEDTHIN